MPPSSPCWRKVLRPSESGCDFPMSSACPPRPKRPWRLPCWLMKPGTGVPRTFPPQPVRNELRFWERSPMRKGASGLGLRASDLGRQDPRSAVGRRVAAGRFTLFSLIPIILAMFPLLSCSAKPDPNTLVMIIESSPTNLDPRVGIDAPSERIDSLIFDDLLSRGENLDVAPGLAERWEIPDPLTYIFHLHRGVKFHDGRALTARDVKWTFDSLLQGKIRSTKAAVYRFVDHIDAPDDFTVIFHMKEPSATLLWNVSDGAIGIVPYGSGDEMTRHPIGSGPFKFANAETDKEVVLERNAAYLGEKAKLARVRFAVVPDATTEALELRKGSGDITINSLTPDTVLTLEREPFLAVEHAPGTEV